MFAGFGALVVIGLERRQGDAGRIAWGRGAQLTGLLLLAPICAEYLAADDDSTGDPQQLIAGLFVFVPLYGCAALLIREVARRARLGWPGIVLLAAAVGLLQAGVFDQSLFSVDYRQIEGWDEKFRATLIAPLGVSAVNLANFVGGHVIFTLCGPIALIEAVRPRSATRPWLGWRGLVLTAAGYAAAAVMVLTFHLRTEESHASPGQVIGTLVIVLALVAGGLERGLTSVTGPLPAVGASTVGHLRCGPGGGAGPRLRAGDVAGCRDGSGHVRRIRGDDRSRFPHHRLGRRHSRLSRRPRSWSGPSAPSATTP